MLLLYIQQVLSQRRLLYYVKLWSGNIFLSFLDFKCHLLLMLQYNVNKLFVFIPGKGSIAFKQPAILVSAATRECVC